MVGQKLCLAYLDELYTGQLTPKCPVPRQARSWEAQRKTPGIACQNGGGAVSNGTLISRGAKGFGSLTSFQDTWASQEGRCSQGGPRAGAEASVLIPPGPVSTACSEELFSLTAQTSNSKPWRKSPLYTAPNSGATAPKWTFDFFWQRFWGARCRGLDCWAGDAAATPSPAGGGAPSQTLGVPGAGSVRSLAGRRRRGAGVAV